MGITRLEGDFLPVEIRGYCLKTMKTHYDFAVIATDENNKILATGKDAYKFIDSVEGKAIGHINVYSTFKRNVVAEFEETVVIVKSIYKEIYAGVKSKILRPTVVLCIPFELTGVERKAFEEVFLVIGAKNVTILQQDFEENKSELANNYSIVFGIIPNKLIM